MPQPNNKVDPRIARVLAKLAFTPEGVINAAVDNTPMFKDVADYRIDCLHNYNNADMTYDQLYAQRSIEVREQHKRMDMKLTEDGLKSILCLDPTVADARLKRMRAEEIDAHAKLMIEMIRMRRDSLETVAGLIGSAEAMHKAAEEAASKMEMLRESARRKYPGAQHSSRGIEE